MFNSLLPLAALAAAAVATGTNPKRGMLSDLDDQSLVPSFISTEVTTVSWYYSFGQYAVDKYDERGYEFVMQQFGIDEGPDSSGNHFKDITQLGRSVAARMKAAETDPKKTMTHLMTFLEPGGGSFSIPVDKAVDAWIKYIAPLRETYPSLKIGSPSLINGDTSVPWLNNFTTTCNGRSDGGATKCAFDFIDAHYYGTWANFQSTAETWRKAFPSANMWLSDIGFNSDTQHMTGAECSKTDTQCVGHIETAVQWMDKQDWVERYTFRGEISHNSDKAMFGWDFVNDDGSYTDLGKWYLGVGASAAASSGSSSSSAVAAATVATGSSVAVHSTATQPAITAPVSAASSQALTSAERPVPLATSSAVGSDQVKAGATTLAAFGATTAQAFAPTDTAIAASSPGAATSLGEKGVAPVTPGSSSALSTAVTTASAVGTAPSVTTAPVSTAGDGLVIPTVTSMVESHDGVGHEKQKEGDHWKVGCTTYTTVRVHTRVFTA